MSSPTPSPDSYGSQDIEVFRNTQHIRRRAGMYVGDTGPFGFHQLLWELVHNSIDEFRSGHASAVEVALHSDGFASVADDGRGLPVDPVRPDGQALLTLLCTSVGSGWPPPGPIGKVGNSLWGIGLVAVTALSECSEVESCQAGTAYRQQFSRGEAVGPLLRVGPTDRTGTRIRFKPDLGIFTCPAFDRPTIEERLRELAFLHPGLRATLSDEHGGATERFHSPEGAADMVRHLNRAARPVHAVVRHHRRHAGGRIDVALQYARPNLEQSLFFVNGCRIPRGPHVTGFRAGLTRAVNAFRKLWAGPASVPLTGDQIRNGLTAVVALDLAEPRFIGATWSQLGNPEAAELVRTATHAALTEDWRAYPEEGLAALRHLTAWPLSSHDA